jgi:hypothetical protein
MSTYPEIKLRDQTSVPGVAYGVGTALYRQECVEEVKGALAAGFRHLDLAEVYETSGSAGKAIKESGIPRDELYSMFPFSGRLSLRADSLLPPAAYSHDKSGSWDEGCEESD